LVNME